MRWRVVIVNLRDGIASLELVERVLKSIHQILEEELVIVHGISMAVSRIRGLNWHGSENIRLVPLGRMLLVRKVCLRRLVLSLLFV